MVSHSRSQLESKANHVYILELIHHALDWQNSQFSIYWPGWNAKIKQTHPEIQTISKYIFRYQKGTVNAIIEQRDLLALVPYTLTDDYYGKTVDVVINLLKKRLEGIDPSDLEAQADQWDKWTKNWCQFSWGSFLRSTLEAIKSLVVFDPKDKVSDKDIEKLKEFLHWPEAAITAYNVFNYTGGEISSLATHLQEKMGKWWSKHMHSLDGGLSTLPEALAAKEIQLMDGSRELLSLACELPISFTGVINSLQCNTIYG